MAPASSAVLGTNVLQRTALSLPPVRLSCFYSHASVNSVLFSQVDTAMWHVASTELGENAIYCVVWCSTITWATSTSGQHKKILTQPARDLEQSALVKLVVHALVSADSTGHGKTGFRRIRSVLDNHWVHHIISLCFVKFWTWTLIVHVRLF